MTRKQRREFARLNKKKFEPQYNGAAPVYKINREDFSNKFVNFAIDSSVIESSVVDSSEVLLESSESIGNNIKNDSVVTEKTGLLSKIKNLFKKERK